MYTIIIYYNNKLFEGLRRWLMENLDISCGILLYNIVVVFILYIPSIRSRNPKPSQHYCNIAENDRFREVSFSSHRRRLFATFSGGASLGRDANLGTECNFPVIINVRRRNRKGVDCRAAPTPPGAEISSRQ